MNKALRILIAFAFLFSMAMPLYAADLPKPVDKLVKGTTEVVKSPIVLYDHTKMEMEDHDYPVMGFFKGIVTSPFHMMKEVGHGLFTIITFPIDN